MTYKSRYAGQASYGFFGKSISEGEDGPVEIKSISLYRLKERIRIGRTFLRSGLRLKGLGKR